MMEAKRNIDGYVMMNAEDLQQMIDAAALKAARAAKQEATNLDNLTADTTGMQEGENRMPRKWITVGTDEHGQPIKKNFHGKTEEELLVKIAMELIRRGAIAEWKEPKKEKTLFSVFAAEWLEIPKKRKREVNTIASYEHSLKGRILPYFGTRFIEDVTSEDVQTWIDSMPGLARKTVQHHKRILTAILDRAVSKKLIQVNPARDEDIYIPNIGENKRTAISNAEWQRIKKSAMQMEPEYRKMIMIPMCTGMRKGELLALRWEDIDFETGWIHIRHGAKLKKAARIGTTKTKSSVRDVRLLDTLRAVLEPLREDGNKLVIGGKYRPICDNTFGKRMKYICERIPEMNGYTLHYFRHTFLSMMAAAGADVATVQRWAGHKKASTTLDVYYHDMAESIEKAAKLVDDWMNKDPSEETDMHMDSVA